MKIGDKVIFFGEKGVIVGEISDHYFDVQLGINSTPIPVWESEMVPDE